MSITRAAILSAVLSQVQRTDKDSVINEFTQWICDDIADNFKGYRGLRERTSAVTLTINTSYVDVSTELANLYGSRIQSVSLIDSANVDNNLDLEEITYEEYLKWLEDPDNPDSEHYGDPMAYCIEGDYMYFKEVPDLTTYSVRINFGKVHPTITDSVDISYPANFKECIVQGVLWKFYESVERKDQLKTYHMGLYIAQRGEKIRRYLEKPNMRDKIKIEW